MNGLARAGALSAALVTAIIPGWAYAQSVNVTHSTVPERPYTIIYPEVMQASGGGTEPLIINHPNAPLQCSMNIVPVENTGWTAQDALASLDDSEIIGDWSGSFPGFTLASKGTTPYQSVEALTYTGTSTGSPQGVPITLVHTEAVDGGRGYVLDCFYATEVAAQAAPVADFVIANFSTRSDAECCIGVEVVPSTEP